VTDLEDPVDPVRRSGRGRPAARLRVVFAVPAATHEESAKYGQSSQRGGSGLALRAI
jgi:hypothetical protein